jgi:hypothetical protein
MTHEPPVRTRTLPVLTVGEVAWVVIAVCMVILTFHFT